MKVGCNFYNFISKKNDRDRTNVPIPSIHCVCYNSQRTAIWQIQRNFRNSVVE